MTTDRLDVIVFGATGYTGRYCFRFAAKLLKDKNYSWAIAGKCGTKLKELLSEYETNTGEDLSHVPIIVADANDYDSVRRMTSRAKVIINCIAPLRLYVETIVKACIETRTHQVDTCADPLCIETIAIKYHEAARNSGIYIISACGFNSVPCDFGVIYAEQQFQGTLNSVESYVEFDFGIVTDSPVYLNYTSWDSIIHCMTLEYRRKAKQIHNELYPKPMPKLLPVLKNKPSIHKFDMTNTWNVPLEGADPIVVFGTQHYLLENKRKRPVQIKQYMSFKSLYLVLLMALLGVFLQLMVLFKFTRNLLLKYPTFWSFGYCKPEGPSEEVSKGASFQMTLIGKGWKERLSEPEDAFSTPPTETIICRLSGMNPGYGITGCATTLAAIVVLEEADKMPKGGGVYTTGSAFYTTSYMAKLQKHCLKFEVVKNN